MYTVKGVPVPAQAADELLHPRGIGGVVVTSKYMVND
jgi:hypothetical protein